MSGRIIICQTDGPWTKDEPRPARFVHDEDCRAHGFLSLQNARYFKRMGWCKCDVPMEDNDACDSLTKAEGA